MSNRLLLAVKRDKSKKVENKTADKTLSLKYDWAGTKHKIVTVKLTKYMSYHHSSNVSA